MIVRRRKGATTLLGVAVSATAVGYLLWGGIDRNLVYFLTPSEVLAREPAAGAAVRIGGRVEPGSVRWDADRAELRFRITDDSASIEVLSTGAPPQMFREARGVVVEGAMTAGGTFQSGNVMVKHSNEYRAPPPGARPAAEYRRLFGARNP